MPDVLQRRFFRHLDKPEWGVGVLVDERDGKRTIDFQHGKRHVIAQSFWGQLAEEEPSKGDEVAALTANESITKSLEPKKGRRPSRAAAAPRITFDIQLARLAAGWPGGLADARPTVGDAGKKLAAAVASGEGAVPRVKEALAAGGLLHPVELIQVTNPAPENAAAYLTALRALLEGSGDYAARFDALVGALGAAKPTWTMATVFASLVSPNEHVFVKPGLFQTQARILGMPITGYNTHPSGAVYAQFQTLAKTVGERLAAAGHRPRDLMDVYAFIWRTLSPATQPRQPETPGTGQPTSDPESQPES
jgi:hypothetical protein